MLYRGSFQAAISAMANQFRDKTYDMLALIYAHKGKYYSVVTEAQLLELPEDTPGGSHRLVMRVTPYEFKTLTTGPQIAMFPHEE